MARKAAICVALSALALSINVAGCSKTTVATTPPSPTPAPQPSPQPSTAAKYDCAAVKPTVAQPGSQSPDILGVRLGMPPTMAAAILACGNPKFVLSTDQGGLFDLPAIEHGPQPETSLDAKLPAKVAADVSSMGTDPFRSGPVYDDLVAVMFVGLASRERAAWLARQEHYPDGNLPSVANVVNSLVQKYGPPTSDTGTRGSSRALQWIHEPSGAAMNPNDPHYLNCGGIGGYGSSFQITSDCGLTVTANLVVAADGGVGELNIAVMDQAAANAAIQREKADIALINTPPGSTGKL